VAMRERKGGRPSQNPFKATMYLARASLALAFAYVRPSVDIARLEEVAS